MLLPVKERGRAHLPLLTADLAQPDGVGTAVGCLNATLGADVLRRERKMSWGRRTSDRNVRPGPVEDGIMGDGQRGMG